ncbi:2-succinylbenzoate--CoA ligase [Halioglobus japonicus]|nr:2-succinylbenzoate--CoA ligase [Halioglobus japonicus]
MIEERFRDALARCPERAFLLGARHEHSYSDFYQHCLRLAGGLSRLEGHRIACYMADSAQLIAIMLSAGMSGKSLLLLSRDFTEQQLPTLLQRYDVDTLFCDSIPRVKLPANVLDANALDVIAESEPLIAPMEGEVLLLTSGTTGDPKCARYSWGDLFAQVKEREVHEHEYWLLAYRLNHFAGLQMLVHVLRNNSTLVFAQSNKVSHAIEAMRHFPVTHVSSTPTFWRYALATLPSSEHGLALKHITLGSEPVSASLLEQLQQAFPDTRIVHIYASTEAGSCVCVSDMRPGLPVSILQRDDSADVQFQIRDEELYIRSAHGMRDYVGSEERADRDEEGWMATGDLVRIEDKRIVFMGRRTETINVGGVKVHPLEVENVISAIEGVKLARVFGMDNPVVGQIVAVDVVTHNGHSEQAVEAAIREACLVLSRHARPRSIHFVDTMETHNFKLKRQ